MSSATANSAARKRRAGKQGEITKQNVQKQNDLQYRDIYTSNDYYDMESRMKPILNSKDAIYFMNNRLLVVENVLQNIGKNKSNEVEQLNAILERMTKLEKKIADTIISSNVKNNMLETDIITVKESLSQLIESNNSYSKIFDKMQSLVIYDNDNDDSNDELKVETLNMEPST
jgi:hypothetical protein